MREQLLKAAYASTDDTERLVLADWLEQHGELARAQVIHMQCELARTSFFDRRYQELAWELDAVLAELRDAWHAELPVLHGVEWLALERGMPAAVGVRDVATLVAQQAAIHAAAPEVYRVVLRDLHVGADETDIPWLRSLRLSGVRGANPLLSIPSELEIDAGEFDDVDDLERDRPLAALAIVNSAALGDDFAQMLAEASWTGALRVLRMPTARAEGATSYYDHDPRMTADGAAALVTLDSLEILQIDRHLPGVRNAERLFALPRLRDFSARQIGVKKLAVPTKGDPFESVDLSQNAIGTPVARAIAKSPRMVQLQRLVLDTCEVEAMALVDLVRSPLWKTLRILDLSRNPLGSAGARALAEAPEPALLHTLRLADVDFDDACGPILGKIRWLGRLLELDLTGNRFGRGLAALRDLEVDGLRKLTLLSIGMERSEAVVRSKFWPKLMHLAVGDNAIGDAGIERFATTKEATALQSLALWKCNLTDGGLDLLAGARCPRLRLLELWGNRFSGTGIAELLAAPIMNNVGVLDLRDCGLAARDVEAIGATPMPPALHTLDLRANELSEQALLVLAESPTLRTVKQLRIDGNPFTFDPRNRERLAERFGPTWYQAE
jgi:uncharacterized protein (TIGR02996 family)